MSIKFLIELMIIFSVTFIFKMLGFLKKTKDIKLILLISCFNIGLNVNNEAGKEQIYISLLTTVIFIIFIINIKKKLFKLTLNNLCMLLICIASLQSYFLSYIYNKGSYWNLNLTYLSIFILGLIFNYKNGDYDYIKITELFTYIAIANGILGVFQFVTNKKLLYGQFNNSLYFKNESGMIVKRVVGIVGSNNAAGNLGFILFTVVLFNYLRSKEKINLVALIITTVFSILTLTRIGYVSIILTIVLNILIIKWNNLNAILKKVLLCGIGLLVIGIIFYFCGDLIIDILFKQRGNTQDARGIQFKFILDKIITKNNIMSGIGTGQYKDYAYNNFNYTDIDIHSQYLNFYAENGLMVFLAVIFFNVNLFILAFKNCDNNLEKVFITNLFLGNLICCNFNPNEYYQINNIFYYLLMYDFAYRNRFIYRRNYKSHIYSYTIS
ncbi:O-antigen ligase family protein [Clostridium butyricum]|uniref:O-antigen ligase family protein n=1 Tax=Clostridium butyricum TaxID=1492 RepID=UPI003D33F179